MSLTAGQRLGPYEIVAPLGSGGMGEVWRAHDTRLDRSVAIKVLPAEFARNAQLKARFEREAKTISQLNHPNICTLYDVGRDGGTDYLVMELVDGETLADRIARGPLPVADVLRLGVQIAEALDRAHSAGIVHRDLKPGNVMLGRGGAKLLDFGLAKSGGALSAVSHDDATVQKSLTQEGTIVGTFQYMSPEQLEGADVDPRSDIFALGAVLYEMVTGKRAFEGKNKTSLIAAIVGSEPKPVNAVQPLAPAALEHVIRKCLAKDRDERWQSARDIAGELRWIAESRSGEAAKVPAPRRMRWTLAAAIVAAALIAAATTALVMSRMRRADPPMVLSLTLPPRAPYEWFNQAALSPDGTAVAFVGREPGQSLWVRELAQQEPRPLPDSAGAEHPFWSPDSRSVAFFADGKLKRVAIAGGPPQTICAAPGPSGGAWSRNGVIVFGAGERGLSRVDAVGGAPRIVTRLAATEEAHRWPSFLPDGDHFVFLGDAPIAENHHIKVGSLRDGSTRDLFQGITNAQYVEPGYLLFVRAGALLAQPFDAKSLAVSGEPRVLAENITGNGTNHVKEFSASANGRLLYRTARAEARLTWLDRSGKTIESVGEPRRIGEVIRLSPDQQRIAFDTDDVDGRSDDIWMLDRNRAITSRLTFDPASEWSPTWSPDGTNVAFISLRTPNTGLYIADVANPTGARFVATDMRPESWVGDTLVGDRQQGPLFDILVLSLKSGRVESYLTSSFSQASPALSPDGLRIAYVSDESGRGEVYVEEFPSHAHRRQISAGGGWYPNWRGDGRELFYISRDHSLMSADMATESSTPKPLFHLLGETYEAAADAQRFLVDVPLEDATKVPITVTTNWLASGR